MLALMLVVFALICAGSISTDSILIQVNRKALDRKNFVFRVETEPREDGSVTFRFFVNPKEDREEWCTSGSVEVVSGNTRIGTFRIQGDDIEKEWKWEFQFTIDRGVLRGSRFTFLDYDCQMPAFDGYWFDLEEYSD